MTGKNDKPQKPKHKGGFDDPLLRDVTLVEVNVETGHPTATGWDETVKNASSSKANEELDRRFRKIAQNPKPKGRGPTP